nr:lipoate-protein ligase [Theileria orientalis]
MSMGVYKNISVVFSKETDIYFNLSLENYLLSTYGSGRTSKFGPNSPLLYLWRNSPCVIVGRNQNVWSECNLENIKEDVKIVRRFTGGGAVYQDLGNTCFTFISDSKNYNFQNNSELICAAVSKLIGQKCEPTGRNDLCVNGLKFSGAAFKVLPNAALHHGTLLININKGSLEKYLTPEKSKLAKHNVKSVEARVTNLAQFKPDVTHSEVWNAIVQEAMDFYGVKEKEVYEVDYSSEFCKESSFKDCYDKLTDKQWIFGKRLMDPKTYKNRFDFGSVEFCLDVKEDTVENVYIYSDMLNADLIDYMNGKFNEGPFKMNAEEFKKKFEECECPNGGEAIEQIKSWLLNQLSNKE